MKCNCDRATLSEALSATSSVIASRTPKPILQCVRLTAEQDALVLTAYDQEVGLRYRVQQVEVTKPGETLVPGDRLLAIVRESQDETLAFEAEADLLHIRGRDSHFQVVGQNVREFPPVPDMEGEPDFVVKVGELRAAVERTVFAAARENTRYAINGVLWQKSDKKLQLVATDGRRLALSTASLEKASKEEASAIVPLKPLTLLGRLHFEADEALEVRLSPNQIVMRTERATISSVLVEGRFPKWEDVLPHDLDKKLTLSTSQFLSGVTRAALLASMESKGIRMHLHDRKMTLSSRSAEQGEATVEVDLPDYTGGDLLIGFNPEFLRDALRVCEEQVTFELKEGAKPGVLTSGPKFKYVVMPVNLS
ncbi:MAG TPA: DNA polymerase III subunit beta [Phycisphaerae bacterium]|nr:DNA polymerase III subunit beta [Phycisphaerae bacterium]